MTVCVSKNKAIINIAQGIFAKTRGTIDMRKGKVCHVNIRK